MASSVMDKMQRFGIMKEVEEVKNIFKGEGVEAARVGSEVAVVYLETTRELAAGEVTLGEVAGLMQSFPVGEGVDLLTMEQISKMNVVIIAMMVG